MRAVVRGQISQLARSSGESAGFRRRLNYSAGVLRLGNERSARWLVGLALCACTDDDVVASLAPRVTLDAGRLGMMPTPPALLDGGENEADGEVRLPVLDAADGECAALYCSDFEQELEQADVVASAGSVVRSTERARSGQHSLGLAIDGAGATAALMVRVPTVSAGELYVRVHVLVPATTQLRDIVVLSLSDDVGQEGINVDLWDGERVELYLPADQISDFSERGTVARDEWLCLTLHAEVDDADGEASLLRGTAVVAEVSGVDTLPPGGISRLGLGVTWSHAEQPAAELWIDDVVVSLEPLGCD